MQCVFIWSHFLGARKRNLRNALTLHFCVVVVVMYSVIVLLSSFASHLENSTKTDLGTSLSSDAKKVVGDDIRSFSKLDRGFKFFFLASTQVTNIYKYVKKDYFSKEL